MREAEAEGEGHAGLMLRARGRDGQIYNFLQNQEIKEFTET